jgi:methionyl-tRNA formyltransferase
VTSPRIIFAGTPEFSVSTLDKLIELGATVVGVYCQPDRRSGRGRKLNPCAVKLAAEKHQLPVFQPHSLRDPDEQSRLVALNADLMVVVAYGLLLPEAVLVAPKRGCVNLHASLLPRFRGAAPIHRAILSGDEKTGVTLMQMDIGLDTGDMLASVTTNISIGDTSADLHDRLSQLGAELLADNLHNILSGEISATRQDDNLATYAAKIERSEGLIDWSLPAYIIERRIRGFTPWPGCYSHYNGVIIKIWRAAVLPSPPNPGQPGEILKVDKHAIVVQCGEQTLGISVLQKPGARKMNCNDFLNGTSVTVASRFE